MPNRSGIPRSTASLSPASSPTASVPTLAITAKAFAISTANSQPDGIVAGPDGNLWFTEARGNQIERITPDGKITEFALPTANSSPGSITVGPDGNLWFTEFLG